MKYSTCNFSLQSAQDISDLISRKIADCEPFSLTRLGDGEGLLLSISRHSTESDFEYLTAHLGPAGTDLGIVRHLRDRLAKAIRCTDILGVRNDIINVDFVPENFSLPQTSFLEIFRNSFRLREIDKELGYFGARRIAFLHNFLRNASFHEDVHFCSAWISYDFHVTGVIFELLRSQQRIGLISCRPKLPTLLEELFDISVKFYEIPEMFRAYPKDKGPPNYIDRLENVLSQQLVDFPGMLYIIGGGLYGKIYCQLIKSQGGIALDLGSLFDAWLGIPSRKLVYISKFNIDLENNAVPPQLLLTAKNIGPLLKKSI